MSPIVMPLRASTRSVAWTGPVQVVVRLGADQALRDDARPRSQSERPRAVLLGEQDGGRAVGDLR